MRWRLLVELPEGPRRFELTEGEHTVGADSRCAIHLPEATVSRRHARLRVRSDALQVEDVGSRNGTWLGRSRLDAPAELQAGSALIFGTVPARVEAVAEEDAKAALLFEISGSIPAVVEEGRVETAGVSLLEVFVLDRLPRLLEGLYPRDSKALAKILDEHLHQLVPPVWSETREPAARGIFEIGDRRLRLRPGADPRLAEPLLETMAALWRLHEGLERSLYRVRPRLPDPPALPAPATRDPAVQRLYADAARVARGEVSV
ncbi:MAG: FHA domain-containing protein, partial [Acidobacteriota bacterium]